MPDYYKRLTVIVTTDRRVYYVRGQVRSSGRQEYIGPTTVLKAIASAGDFTDFADRKKVHLTRTDGKRITVDCIKAAKDSTYDLPVFPGTRSRCRCARRSLGDAPTRYFPVNRRATFGRPAVFPVRVGRAAESDLCAEEDGVWAEHFQLSSAVETGFTLTAYPGALVTGESNADTDRGVEEWRPHHRRRVKLSFRLSVTRQRSLRPANGSCGP